MKKAVFLDRDGTIIEDMNYLRDPANVKLIPGASSGIKLLKENGFRIVIVTNQSGIARGYFDLATLENIHEVMDMLLRYEGVFIDAIYFCPHHPEGLIEQYRVDCSCRKPSPLLARKAKLDLDISLEDSYMIGDKESDVIFGYNFGAKGSILVTNGKCKINDIIVKPNYVANDLQEAAKWILLNEEK